MMFRMDFESLSRFILCAVQNNTKQKIQSIDDLILAIDETYQSLDLE
ncbi:hypothetical protein HO929_06810 [Streptococcus suis]|nr:hypothetical protein [Streptococcus suis]MBM7179286.1 hypothetical protein [Streptococcus suis]NQH48694.1 hypothetical protein [Streptococcus suis]NQO67318.1 hypothetical protein [Streptococcus suis]NQP29698.1 hypothetical protein [Streptococcus suis]NQR30064.1 hypothetical protein [Streptococcus suis]